MSNKKFINRIQRLNKLTPKERKIADFFSRNYDDIVFENLSSISRKTSVSKPTVVRFIAKLGFKKFADFHKELREELSITNDTLNVRYSLKKKLLDDSEEDIIAQNFTNIIKNLETTHKNLSKKTFMTFAKTIAQTEGKIYVTGQRSSYALAYIFQNMIKRVLPNTVLVEPQTSMEPDFLIDVNETDVLFAIFRQPYSNQTALIIKYFASIGAQTLLLTDNELNPVSDIVSHQLKVDTEGVSIFTSSASIVAVLESLNIAVLGFSDHTFSERIEKAESLYTLFNSFVNTNKSTI
jgi:DNA-binding MurR/RpiR family transcriptional regulator